MGYAHYRKSIFKGKIPMIIIIVSISDGNLIIVMITILVGMVPKVT